MNGANGADGQTGTAESLWLVCPGTPRHVLDQKMSRKNGPYVAASLWKTLHDRDC
jgi:hypothetical protein